MEKVGRLKRTIRKLALLEHKLEEKTIQLANQEHHDEGKVSFSHYENFPMQYTDFFNSKN